MFSEKGKEKISFKSAGEKGGGFGEPPPKPPSYTQGRKAEKGIDEIPRVNPVISRKMFVIQVSACTVKCIARLLKHPSLRRGLELKKHKVEKTPRYFLRLKKQKDYENTPLLFKVFVYSSSYIALYEDDIYLLAV